MTAEALKQTIKVCMFDQYGTVVDMQKGLTEAVAPYLTKKGWSGRPDAFVTWWRRTHFENSMIDVSCTRSTARIGRSRIAPWRTRSSEPEFPTRWTILASSSRRSSG
jgi:phosphoglycolate phosphatase-like HAD superfamily hydrolase